MTLRFFRDDASVTARGKLRANHSATGPMTSLAKGTWRAAALGGVLLTGGWRLAQAQVLIPCPSPYAFNTTYTFGSTSNPPKFYNFRYVTGVVLPEPVVGIATYRFANILSNDGGAWLIGPWILTACSRVNTILPTGELITLIFIESIDHGGTLQGIFTRPGDDECDDGGDDGDGDGGGDDNGDEPVGGEYLMAPAPAGRAAESRPGLFAPRMDELLRPSRLPSRSLRDIISASPFLSQARSPRRPPALYEPHRLRMATAASPGTGLAQVSTRANVCWNPPGGGGGDGAGETWYCLIVDWYDLSGNYLYSDVITCWQEGAQ